MKERNEKIINFASAVLGSTHFLQQRSESQADIIILGTMKSYLLDIMTEAGFTEEEMGLMKNFTINGTKVV